MFDTDIAFSILPNPPTITKVDLNTRLRIIHCNNHIHHQRHHSNLQSYPSQNQLISSSALHSSPFPSKHSIQYIDSPSSYHQCYPHHHHQLHLQPQQQHQQQSQLVLRKRHRYSSRHPTFTFSPNSASSLHAVYTPASSHSFTLYSYLPRNNIYSHLRNCTTRVHPQRKGIRSASSPFTTGDLTKTRGSGSLLGVDVPHNVGFGDKNSVIVITCKKNTSSKKLKKIKEWKEIGGPVIYRGWSQNHKNCNEEQQMAESSDNGHQQSQENQPSAQKDPIQAQLGADDERIQGLAQDTHHSFQDLQNITSFQVQKDTCDQLQKSQQIHQSINAETLVQSSISTLQGQTESPDQFSSHHANASREEDQYLHSNDVQTLPQVSSSLPSPHSDSNAKDQPGTSLLENFIDIQDQPECIRSRLSESTPSMKILCVGDLHDQWCPIYDTAVIKYLKPDLVLFVGDFGNESLDLVREIALLAYKLRAESNIQVVNVFGNHDAWFTAPKNRRKFAWYQNKNPKVTYNSIYNDNTTHHDIIRNDDGYELPSVPNIDPSTDRDPNQRRDVVKEQLDLMDHIHAGYRRKHLAPWSISVIGGRPFSFGGPLWKYSDFYQKYFLTQSMEHSAMRIKAAVDECLVPEKEKKEIEKWNLDVKNNRCGPDATSLTYGDDVIFLSHNGPFGLGDKPEDPCGKDWTFGSSKPGGDFGDMDLRHAINYAKVICNLNVPLVVFGHMHKNLCPESGGGVRTMVKVETEKGIVSTRNPTTVMINAAVFPRITETVHDNVVRTMRQFTMVELVQGVNGGVTKVEEVWVDNTCTLSERYSLYDKEEEQRKQRQLETRRRKNKLRKITRNRKTNTSSTSRSRQTENNKNN